MRENGRIVSIQVGRPRQIPGRRSFDAASGAWYSAIYKDAVSGPVWLGRQNLEGDAQADLKVHGGPDKAVLAYAAEHYPAWQTELLLEDFPYGAFGENFTVEGLGEEDVCIGDTYAAGKARLQVSQPRSPCVKLARKWDMKDLPARVVNSGRTGWYFRVTQEGPVESGLPLTLLDRPHPGLTIALAHRLAFDLAVDPKARAELARCPLLSPTWRRKFGGG